MKICIVGAGRGGTAVMKFLFKIEECEVVGIADPNDTPGTQEAARRGIPVFKDWRQMLDQIKPEIVIEATGVQDVEAALRDYTQDHGIKVVDSAAAKLLMSLVMFNVNVVNEEMRRLNDAIDQISAVIQEMASSINEVVVQQNKLLEKVKSVEELSHKIEDIFKLVQGIADETKMLGLNAAIEAARVGDMGRGFAVVAEEIRKLSEESKQTIKQVEQSLHSILTRVNESVEGARQTVFTAEQQAAAVQELTASIQEISSMSNQLVSLINID